MKYRSVFGEVLFSVGAIVLIIFGIDICVDYIEILYICTLYKIGI